MLENSETGVKIKLLAVYFGFFFFVASVSVYAFFSVPSQKFENKVFWIEEGKSSKQISKNLKKEKIINSSLIFDLIVFFAKKEKTIRAGKYIFEKPTNTLNVFRVILTGPKSELVKITTLPGWTKEKIGEYFDQNNFFLFSKDDWLKAASDSEGYLFPDTYLIDKDLSPEQIVKIMRENFESKITPEIKIESEGIGKNFYEILIMAALLEKEAFDSLEEKKMISGVLWKRLKNNMPLQVDATITYITGKPSLKLTETDLVIDSPFNTYKYAGLPPSPIGNPGIESIQAAVAPEDSPYWYYLHDSKGRIHYAKTFEEHKINKTKYLR